MADASNKLTLRHRLPMRSKHSSRTSSSLCRLTSCVAATRTAVVVRTHHHLFSSQPLATILSWPWREILDFSLIGIAVIH
ncbi:uncharacterized protein DS421_14g474440 [Arachis hypogaea]|nr:uncharacterized protein DS421_14g474440 [Arachis hypogaea]